jgi:hypothetical protein
MRGQVVIEHMSATGTVREDMISVPCSSDLAAADMTTSTGLAQDDVTLSSRQSASRNGSQLALRFESASFGS